MYIENNIKYTIFKYSLNNIDINLCKATKNVHYKKLKKIAKTAWTTLKRCIMQKNSMLAYILYMYIYQQVIYSSIDDQEMAFPKDFLCRI